jgi:hypothetical protein
MGLFQKALHGVVCALSVGVQWEVQHGVVTVSAVASASSPPAGTANIQTTPRAGETQTKIAPIYAPNNDRVVGSSKHWKELMLDNFSETVDSKGKGYETLVSLSRNIRQQGEGIRDVDEGYYRRS